MAGTKTDPIMLQGRLRQRRGDDLVTVRQRQHGFSLIVIGVLVNICILNLFVEHVDAVVIDSFSISMLTAILLSVMVWTIAGFVHRVSGWFGGHPGRAWKVAGFFAVWGILFLSKFVILEVVDIVFRDHVELGKLVPFRHNRGIMAATRTVVQEGPFAQFIPDGVRVGDLITLSGQVGLGDQGKVVAPGDVA